MKKASWHHRLRLAGHPGIRPKQSQYLGKLSANHYDAESVSKPLRHPRPAPIRPTSINNPYGQYGNPYSPLSVTNP